MIMQQVTEYLELCFTMPVLPASLLLIFIFMYGLIAAFGVLDIELFNFDLDFDADADISGLSSIGFVTLKFFNIGKLPIMIWVSVFGLAWWTISQLLWYAFEQNSPDPQNTLLVVRNGAAGFFITKYLTNPLVTLFADPKPFLPEDLIGQECEISTFEATADFGQAKCKTEAAPLILDIKMSEGELTKGDVALIVDYDPEHKIHYVVATSNPP